MTLIDELKNSFQLWYQKIKLSLINKSYKEQLLRLPSDNQLDYYYDEISKEWIYKQQITQVGLQNILNLIKISTNSMEVHTENLQAIIGNINTISIDTTNLQAIISDISTMQVNVNNLQAIIGNIGTINTNINNLQAIIANIGTINTNINNLQAIIANIETVNTNIANLQAIITDIANIETLNTTISGNITSLTAIIANIGTMNTNIENLQAIITDISNIETLNTTISGNITSLTAIIANIGTMNTNIANLQAIITDIANIESQNISMNTALANINTNIGTINTAISQINAHQADIDIHIESVNDLDIEINAQQNKGIYETGSLIASAILDLIYDSNDYLYNVFHFDARNLTQNIQVRISIYHKIGGNWTKIYQEIHDSTINSDGVKIINIKIPFNAHPYVRIYITNTGSYPLDYTTSLFFSKNLISDLKTNFNKSQKIGIENKDWINASLQGLHTASYAQVWDAIRNSGAGDMFLLYEFPLPYTIYDLYGNLRNLVITQFKIGLADATVNDKIIRIRMFGWTDYNSGSILATENAERTSANEYITNHADVLVGNVCKKVNWLIETVCTTPLRLDISYFQLEYYYA